MLLSMRCSLNPVILITVPLKSCKIKWKHGKVPKNHISLTWGWCIGKGDEGRCLVVYNHRDQSLALIIPLLITDASHPHIPPPHHRALPIIMTFKYQHLCRHHCYYSCFPFVLSPWKAPWNSLWESSLCFPFRQNCVQILQLRCADTISPPSFTTRI